MTLSSILYSYLHHAMSFNAADTSNDTTTHMARSLDLFLFQITHESGSLDLIHKVHIAHAVLASTAIGILFPSVAIILRVVSSPYIVTLHWVLQLVNMFILMAAFGLGCWLSTLHGFVSFIAPIPNCQSFE